MPRRPKCAWCRNPVRQATGAINRALKLGLPLYCNRKCAGLGRRKGLTNEQKKEAKRLYDIEYRRLNQDSLKAKKTAYYQATYDPETAREYRAKRMPWHVEYCRRPDQVTKRKERDRNRYAAEFGDFAESHKLLMQIIGEVHDRATDYEIRQTNGTLNKHQSRRREYERTLSRESQRGPLGDLTRYKRGRHASGAG